MAADWPQVQLASIIETGRGVSYGIVQPGKPALGGVPIVRVSDVRNGRIDTQAPLRVAPEVEAAYARTRLRGGELLISIVGTVGETAIVPEGLAGWNVARAIAVLPVRREVGPYWLQLALQAPTVRSLIDSRLNTTVQATLNLRDLASLPISLPPREDRDRIIAVLGALDDKIELNRRMNETLEALARAIFKDWFVDFGPTRAKMEGREPYLAPEIWALFPDRLDDDGKPEGWKVRDIKHFASVVYGAPFSSKAFNANGIGLPLIRIRDLATHDPAIFTAEIHPKGRLIRPGDIVVGMDGEFRLHIWKGPKAWLNQRVCHFEPHDGVPSAFLAEALLDPLAYFERGKVGTTVIHLGKSDIDTFRILFPGQHLLDAFGAVAGGLIERTVFNSMEARTLTATRDLLLPKLMSGEIRVKDAEKLAEAAA